MNPHVLLSTSQLSMVSVAVDPFITVPPPFGGSIADHLDTIQSQVGTTSMRKSCILCIDERAAKDAAQVQDVLAL